jgi:outer membrane protein assembly factor BamB
VTYCVDLRTGEELWEKVFLANASISSGQMYYFQSFNYQGTFAYLWVTSGTNWTAFDAFTGEQRWMMTSVPSGTNLYGEDGEIYRYSVSLTGGYMYL